MPIKFSFNDAEKPEPYKMENPVISVEEVMELRPFNPCEVETNNPITHKAFDKMFQSFVYGWGSTLNNEIYGITWGSYMNGVCEYKYEIDINNDPKSDGYKHHEKMEKLQPLFEKICERFDQLNDELMRWEYQNV